MRKVLIAGQHSFIGTAVERRLAAFPDRYAATSLDMHGEDWRLFDLSPFDCVVHVAGIAHVSPEPEMRPLYESVNRDLAVACARRAREMGVKQFIYLSSAIVFGEAGPAGEARQITPETSPSPANAYGRSKLEAEHGLRALEDGRFRVAILRPMMVFGKGCKGNYNALSALARRAPLFPDFPNRRGVVYIDDLAELIRRLIDEGAGGVYHPQTFLVSTADIARAVARAHGTCSLPASSIRWCGRWGAPARCAAPLATFAIARTWPTTALPRERSLWKTVWPERRKDMADLTAIVLTKNEEKNLPDCLSSLRGFAARVVVVDSGSTDRTVDIAREYGADVLLHPFSGYAHQFNWGLDNAAIDTEWVLRIDADERMTEAVKAECAPILALGRESGVGGITMEADFYMLGRRLRFGGAKKRKLMIFRRGWGRIEERCMDEHTLLSEGHDVRIRARFQHYDFKSVGHFASKLVWYSGREVMDVLGAQDGEDLQNAGIRRTRKLKTGLYYRLPRFFRVLCIFLFRYIVQLGFLDGVPGLIYHFMYSFMYRFLVDAKLYEAQKTGKYDTTITALEAKD